jgi:hypothetical protein
MATQITVTIYDDTGAAVGIATPLTWAVVHKVNMPSIASVLLAPATVITAGIEYGYDVQITRGDPSVDMPVYTEFSGQIRRVVREYGANPTLTITAVDGKRILQDRIVAWYPGMLSTSLFTTAAHPTSSAILTELWNRNIGSQAVGNPPFFGPDKSRRYGVGLQRWADGRVTGAVDATDTGIGAAVNLTCSGENLLLTMQKVADIGSIDFDVRWPIGGVPSLYYADILGSNRTAVVKMSQANNTIGTLVRTTERLNAPSLYVAIGRGRDKNKLKALYPTTAPTGTDLREAMATGGDAETVNSLRSAAWRNYVRQQRKTNAYDIEVLQSAMWRYGRDYWLGDLVTIAVTATTTLTRKIYAVSLSMDADGREEVRIDLAATV